MAPYGCGYVVISGSDSDGGGDFCGQSGSALTAGRGR